jgi:hypothetical protein
MQSSQTTRREVSCDERSPHSVLHVRQDSEHVWGERLDISMTSILDTSANFKRPAIGTAPPQLRDYQQAARAALPEQRGGLMRVYSTTIPSLADPAHGGAPVKNARWSHGRT